MPYIDLVQDLLFLTVIVVFFGVCVAYIRGLDRIVRSAEEAETTHEASS